MKLKTLQECEWEDLKFREIAAVECEGEDSWLIVMKINRNVGMGLTETFSFDFTFTHKLYCIRVGKKTFKKSPFLGIWKLSKEIQGLWIGQIK